MKYIANYHNQEKKGRMHKCTKEETVMGKVRDTENIKVIIPDLFAPFYTAESVNLNETNYFIEK